MIRITPVESSDTDTPTAETSGSRRICSSILCFIPTGSRASSDSPRSTPKSGSEGHSPGFVVRMRKMRLRKPAAPTCTS